MPKCIRCGKCVERRTDYKGWVIITYNGPRTVEEKDIKDNSFIDVPSGLLWSGHTMIGLCPDCQLPSEVVGCKDNLQREGPRPIPDDKTRSYAEWLDNIDERIKFLERCRKEHYNEIHQHEHDIETLGGCLAAMEKRTAKLERELDRLWEVIRCMGEK
jgi:hypothetical protein